MVLLIEMTIVERLLESAAILHRISTASFTNSAMREQHVQSKVARQLFS